MKCCYISNIKEIETCDVDDPISEDGYAIIDVYKTGICGADLRYWEVGLPENQVLGHEFVGKVVDNGNRKNLKIGDRVTALPMSPCGKCKMCKSGNIQCCPHAWDNSIGLSENTPGAYSQKVKVRNDMVIKVPNSISDDEAVFISPVAVACHAVKISDIKKTDNVLIIGAGIMGVLCANLVKKAGAKFVAISEYNEKRGQRAVKLKCCDKFYDASDEGFLEKLKKKCPLGYDVVFDCSGTSSSFTCAIASVMPKGRIIMVGMTLQGVTIPSSLIVTKEIQINGSITYDLSDFKKGMALIASKSVNVKKLVDDIVSLGEVQEAFKKLTSRNNDIIKILIDPNKN